MRHSRLLGLAALLAAMVAPGCGGGSDTPADNGPVDADGNDATVNPGGLPVGSACATSSMCAGPGTPVCLINQLSALEAVAGSANEAASTIAQQAIIPFPGNYCSTVAPCSNDSECGEGGTCFLPLVDIDETEYNGLIDALQMPQFETETFYGFRTYGVCLEACVDNNDCTRPGYRCAVPLGEFVSLVEGIGARLETYCVGTPEAICEDGCVNGTCAEDEDTSTWTCECEEGYTGVNCDEQVPGLCPFFDVTAPLQVSATGYDEGEIATFSCAQGFGLVGNATRTCQADGSWTGTQPSCEADPCAGSPCMNGGTCDGTSGSAVCTGCDAGWSGTLCDVPVDCGSLSATSPLTVTTTTTTLNSVATYSCTGNFVLTGGATRTCQSSGDWSGTPPTCEAPPLTCTPNPCDNSGTCVSDGSGNFESCDCQAGWTGATCAVPVTCDVLSATSPLNITYSDTQNAGSVATYACGTGYNRNGSATRTCVDDGSGVGMWSGTAATCERITCADIVVSAPLQTDMASNDFGTTVNYSCATGYNLAAAGPASTTCGASGWSPSNQPTCDIVTCPTLSNPTNGAVDDGTNQYNATAAYSCDTGYEVTGGTTVRCSASGTWSGTPPTCERVSCAARTAPMNGSITPAGPYDYQDTITYMCNNGYSLSGGDASQTCLASGSWSSTAPSCSEILCPALTAPANGSVNHMSRTPGTVASYTCNTSYGLSSTAPVTCQGDGTWMGTPPTCNLLDCGAPPAANANGTRAVPGTTTVGAVTTYSCNTGYTGGGNLTCESDGDWSAATAPACTIVSCGAPPVVTNGAVGAGANTYNSTRTYTCSNDYQIGSGTGDITCLASGNWSTPPTCEPIPDGCATNPCQNGGTCTESGGTFTGCTGCNAGYSGTLCEVAVNCGSLSVTNGSVAYAPMNTTLGSVATTTCTTGYNRTGPATRTCQTDGSWSGAVNTCEPVSCGAAPDGTNSTATETSTTLGGTANYTCATGHVVSGGNATRTCGTNGMWTGTPLSCSLGDCGAPAAAGANASVATPGGTNTGDTATYTCNTGYSTASGVSSRTCNVTGGVASWSPGGASLSCSVVSCGAPPNGSNSAVAFTTTNYNDTAMYSCNNGYTGGPSTITCQANGNWSGGGLSCTPVSCGAAPAANANGTVSGSGTTYNSTRTYSCNAGYMGGGNLTCESDGDWSAATAPACTLISAYCSTTAPVNGSVTGGNTLGSVATYSCGTGYMIASGNAMRTCNANGPSGTLSGTQPTCGPVSCGAAPDGNFSTATATSTVYEGLATYTCNSGYVVSGGNTTRTCTAAGTWSGTPLSCALGDCGPRAHRGQQCHARDERNHDGGHRNVHLRPGLRYGRGRRLAHMPGHRWRCWVDSDGRVAGVRGHPDHLHHRVQPQWDLPNQQHARWRRGQRNVHEPDRKAGHSVHRQRFGNHRRGSREPAVLLAASDVHSVDCVDECECILPHVQRQREPVHDVTASIVQLRQQHGVHRRRNSERELVGVGRVRPRHGLRIGVRHGREFLPTRRREHGGRLLEQLQERRQRLLRFDWDSLQRRRPECGQQPPECDMEPALQRLHLYGCHG
jgi:hypothetical protein